MSSPDQSVSLPPPLLAAAVASRTPATGPLSRRNTRKVLLVALAASAALHLAFSLWPVELASTPDSVPLQATITELPPPPVPAPVAAAPKPKPKPKRAVAPPAPVPAPEPEPAVADAAAADAQAEAIPSATAPAEPVAAAPEEPPLPPVTPDPPRKELPPRVDLAYTVFLGTQGFLIGDATYRFEHSGNQYRMETVGQARGLAALLVRGVGRIESRGLITATGLQPQEFAVERGSKERREVSQFDWETGIITLHEQKTEALELPTFDPLTVLWQFYFAPPAGDALTFTIATTRRVNRYTIERQGSERITWGSGELDTELWHRRSDDGRTDSYVWLAPSLHYVPVKMRIVATNRGTIEALLDSIRVDAPAAEQ
jgi:hypothetical protein